MPRAVRHEPLWQQIASHYKGMIMRGELRQDDPLPSIRAIRDEWQVSQSVAQQAVAHLHLAERLVRTDATGTYVDAPRAALGPQQRAHLIRPPASEVVTVASARVVPAPAYIVPLLDLDEADAAVIRREEVTRLADGTPHMLSVTWCAPQHALPAPELLAERPLPDPRGAAHLIAGRAGYDADDLEGRLAFECRPAKDDGRELPALGLEPGACVQAAVSAWRYQGELLEYTEFILPAGQVIEVEIGP